MTLKPSSKDCPCMARVVDTLEPFYCWLEGAVLILLLLPILVPILALSWLEVGVRRLLGAR